MRKVRSVVIIGAGGHAREVLDIFDARRELGDSVEVLGYLVDPEFASPGTLVNGLPILGGLDWLKDNSDATAAICGVGAPHLRRDLVARASEFDVQWINAIHPSVIMSRWVELGSGVVIAAGCILTNQITVYDHVHLNLDCTVSHDVRIEPFVTVSPGVHISGSVKIQTGAYIGTGANIIEKRTIGEWSVTGAGAVVNADVPPNATAVGVPAKVIKTRQQGWHLGS